MFAVRYLIPAGFVVLGIVLLAIEPGGRGLEGFFMSVGAALSMVLLTWLFRAGVRGDRERDREEAARAHFDRHGRWPDE